MNNIGGFWAMVFGGTILVLLFLLQAYMIYYSAVLFLKAIDKKMKDYGYEKRDSIELVCMRYGMLSVYVLFICLFCMHKIFGLPFMILLFIFNKKLKIELDKNEEEKEER